MKWSKPKRDRYSQSYRINARKNGYKAEVVYNDYYEVFYYLTEKDNVSYNSMWDRLSYKTEEECRIACEKWIDEKVKG
jgi:hypothetical protein